MESYFRLASQFTTQSEPAYCGLGTLCMVLNALGVDPQRQWKGPWRWFEDSMLDCCRPLEQVKKSGITLSEFGCLAVCNGLVAKVHRADTVTASHFLRAIQHTSTQEDKVLCVSYHRGTLGQTGAGHFSPIAGTAPSATWCCSWTWPGSSIPLIGSLSTSSGPRSSLTTRKRANPAATSS
ncbi:Phytochelatin synthase-domain-containing protein, partial [Catenaria anguillulae PL171]